MTHTDQPFPDTDGGGAPPDPHDREAGRPALDGLLRGSAADDGGAWAADTEVLAPVGDDTDVLVAVGDDAEALAAVSEGPVLDSPPSTTSDEELAAALSAPPPSGRSVRLTRVLATSLVVALAFLGGVWAHQQWGSSDQQAGGQARFGARNQSGELPSGFPSGMAFPGANGQGGGTGTGTGTGAAASAPTTGEVTLVDGDVIYLKDSSGNQVRVEVKDSTSITTSKDADMSDVQKGDTVTVTGTTSDSGIDASTVQVSK